MSRDEVRAGARIAVERALQRRRRAAAAMVAVGLGSMALAGPVAGQEPDPVDPVGESPTDGSTTSVPADPFDDTTGVTTVAGDETATTDTTAPEADDDGAFATGPVLQVAGDDQPAGEVQAATYDYDTLVDGEGVEWGIVTDATSEGTELADGAVYDVIVTNGESTTTTYTTSIGSGSITTIVNSYPLEVTDIGEGLHGVCLDPGADDGPGSCIDPSVGFEEASAAAVGDAVIYRPSPEQAESSVCSGREIDLGPQQVGDLTIERRTFVPDDDAFVRHLTFVTNTSASNATVGVDHLSDVSTSPFDSTNGDDERDDAEPWLLSDATEDFAMTHGQVFQGDGTVRAPVDVEQGDGDEAWTYVVDIAPGETIGIATFQTLRFETGDAEATVEGIAAQTNGNQWRCMTDDEILSIANFAQPEPEFAFSVASLTVDEAAGVATVTIVRTGGGPQEHTVLVVTGNGTAAAGADYTPLATSVSFAFGQNSATVQIPILNDTIDEPDETFTVTLSEPAAVPTEVSAAVIGSPATATVTIVDDDLAQIVTTTTQPTTTTTARVGAGALARTGGDIGYALQVAGGALIAGGAAVGAAEARTRSRLRNALHRRRR